MNGKSISKTMATLAYAVMALLGASAHADDWPMYGRDKTRNAVSSERTRRPMAGRNPE